MVLSVGAGVYDLLREAAKVIRPVIAAETEEADAGPWRP